MTGARAGATYKRYAEALTEQASLKEELQNEKNLLDGLEQIGFVISLLFSASPQNNSSYQHLLTSISPKKARVLQLV